MADDPRNRALAVWWAISSRSSTHAANASIESRKAADAFASRQFPQYDDAFIQQMDAEHEARIKEMDARMEEARKAADARRKEAEERFKARQQERTVKVDDKTGA